MVEPHFLILSTQPIAAKDQNLVVAQEQAASRPSLKPGFYCARAAVHAAAAQKCREPRHRKARQPYPHVAMGVKGSHEKC